MTIVAVVTLFCTMLAGTILAALWGSRERATADRRSLCLGVIHIALAAVAGIGWLLYIVSGDRQYGQRTAILLVVAAFLGILTTLSTQRGDRSDRYDARPEPMPVVLLVAHGALATSTIVLIAVVASR